MQGKKITTQQIRVFMQAKKKYKSQKASAAQAGFSERSSYNLQQRGYIEANTKRFWKTRKDPFEEVWNSEIKFLLEQEPHLQAKTILANLQASHPEQFSDSLLRTLYRRIRTWKAFHSPEQEVIFRQNHPPGWQGMSDFTSANSLRITIQGTVYEHLLYHYRLVYTGLVTTVGG